MIHRALAAIACVLGAPCAAAQTPVSTADETPLETRSFSILETRLVRARYENAQEHIAARRYGDAIVELQRIIDDHPSELLGAERPKSDLGHASEQDVHPGAATRARALLAALPPEARALYVKRYEADAARALEAARLSGDRRLLTEIGRRWPITPSAERAWWSLGDLELESGRDRDALFAWARAVAAHIGDPAAAPRDEDGWRAASDKLGGASSNARIQRALTLVHALSAGGPKSESASALRPSGGEGGGPPPGADSDAWPESYHLPWHPLKREPRSDGLFAAKGGDRVFVSTGLRVLALSAFGGQLAWDSGEPDGWSDLSEHDRSDRFKGVDTAEVLLAPAVSADIVVAALQIPWIRVEYANYQNIPITTPIPERRLFAFDAATGRRLWNHAPPLKWNGETGPLEEGMICAGPPVVVGSRVLAPLVRMQGRIAFQVGCFDLETGKRQWSTEIISGQRPANMFGRAEKEFSAPPVRVEGDRVVVLTQLGTVAALDLFSGEILWETLYNQILLPKTQNFHAASRPEPWRNCPPVVSDGVVLAVPFDCEDLVAIDLASGAMLWSRGKRDLCKDARTIVRDDARPVPHDVDLLIGAQSRAIFLGGERLVAFDMPAGLRTPQRMQVRWTWPHDDEARYRTGRAVLCTDRIVAPYDSERVELDLDAGRELAHIKWPDGENGGNLLIGPGEIFALNGASITGIFEWSALLARARESSLSAPNDAARLLEFARLLAGRAAVDWGRGLADPARMRYAEARTALEHALETGPRDAHAALAAELSRCLRGLAQVQAGLGDVRAALDGLRRARTLGAGDAEARDALLEELAILRDHESTTRGAEIDAALGDLERVSGSEQIECTLESSGADGSETRFIPVTAGRATEDKVSVRIPTGLWILFERATLHASLGDTALEFVDLHAVLERWPDVELPFGSSGDVAARRVIALLRAGRREGYAPFEARAHAEFEAATAARDRGSLERIARRYPGSEAARAADDERLALALDQGDVAQVAAIVATEISEEGSTARADENEARVLLHLSGAATRSGNRELGSAILCALADANPNYVPHVTGFDARSLRELASLAPRFERANATIEPGRFGPENVTVDTWKGEFEVLGVMPRETSLSETPAGAPRDLVLVENPSTDPLHSSPMVRCVSSDDPTAPRQIELPVQSMPLRAGPSVWARRTALAPARALFALRDELVALDTTTGEITWRHKPDVTPDALYVACSSGVAVLSVVPRGAADRSYSIAFDTRSGAVLWRAALNDAGLLRIPLLSEREAVYLPSPANTRVLVRDLFTGRVATRFQLPTPAVGGLDLEAWIENGLLIVPWFDEIRIPDRNHIVALDLATGALRWRVPFSDGGERRVLYGIVQQGEKTWLEIGELPREDVPLPAPQLAELTTSIGALTPVPGARLSSEDLIIGLPRHTRVRLPEGPLFILTPRSQHDGPAREARLRAIDPARGELWTAGLGLSFDDVRGGGIVQAAVSESTVVAAIPLYDRSQKPAKVRCFLETFDVGTGRFRDSRDVERTDKGDLPQLYAFGTALFVRRNTQLEIHR